MVRIEPGGLEFEVRLGEAVAEAAWRQGYDWPTRCWGQAECMECRTTVIAGEPATVPADEFELEQMEALLPAMWRTPDTRLACQLHVRGAGVVLAKEGVRPSN